MISRRMWLTYMAGLGLSPILSAPNNLASAQDVPSVGKTPAPSVNNPNIMLIVWDTTRRDRLSLYGYERDTTPNLRKFEKDSVVYDNAYVPSNWTVPSHASLFTGVYPAWHGALSHQSMSTTPRLKTMMEALVDVGYQTVNFTSNQVISNARAARGFMEETIIPHEYSLMMSSGTPISYPSAAKWISSKRDKSRPFFMYLNSLEPHDRYDNLDEPWLRKYLDEDLDIKAFRRSCFERKVIEKTSTRTRNERFAVPYTKHDLKVFNAFYDANIAFLDTWLNSLLSNLNKVEKEVMDNTMVIITSDHGEMLGEHGLVTHHGGMYEELCRVPLVIKYPKGVMAPHRASQRISWLDIPYTIAELAGLNWPDDRPQHGKSLLSYLPEKRTLYMEDGRPNDKSRFKPKGMDDKNYHYMRTILKDDLKYTWKDNGIHNLFDLSRDPKENDNLLETQPEIVAQLHGQMVDFFDNTPFGPDQKSSSPISGDDIEALKALGYID